MSDHEMMEKEEIYSKALRAGRRTYFFDVRPTKAGDYYLTITESKKFTQEFGNSEYKKHKIYLYKEDFEGFMTLLKDVSDFILAEKGEEVISERHIKGFKKPSYDLSDRGEKLGDESADASPAQEDAESRKEEDASLGRFTNIEFDDI